MPTGGVRRPRYNYTCLPSPPPADNLTPAHTPVHNKVYSQILLDRCIRDPSINPARVGCRHAVPRPPAGTGIREEA